MASEHDLTTPRSWRQTESLVLMRRVMELGDEVRRAIAGRSGLSVTEMQALEHLSREPRGPAEIARLLDVSTAASTGIVDRLAAKGHVERRPHARDRRRTEVVMTPSAHAEVMQRMGPMFRAIAEIDDALSEEERAVVTKYLAGVVRAAEMVVSEDAGDGFESDSAETA